jgi:hypothetical protein
LSRLSDILHAIFGFIAGFDTSLTLASTMLFIVYQIIDLKFNNEEPQETLNDIVEFAFGLVVGSIVRMLMSLIF